MDVFMKDFVALFDLLKCFPCTFKLLKKNLINARNHLENMISGWKQKAQKTSPVTFKKYNNIICVHDCDLSKDVPDLGHSPQHPSQVY